MFTSYHSFGDSLTDSGNVALAGGTVYPSGRYSDGPTWAEYLSNDHLDLGPHEPSQAGGNNHAWGGAWTEGGGVVPSVVQQIGGFLSAGGTFQSTDLVTIWAGANDFFGTATQPGGPVSPGVPVGNIGSAIDLLAGADVQHVMVLNLPGLGDTPELAGGPGAAGANAWTQGFNLLLKAELAAKRDGLGICIYEPDIFSRAADLSTNPEKYGLTNGTDAVVPGFTLNPAFTAYWDGIHPTTVTHQIFAQEAFNSIPEPGTGTLAMVALTMGLVRRKR